MAESSRLPIPSQLGTTTLALIGQNVIYVATDARGSHRVPPFMILKDENPKIFGISKNVVATMSGDGNTCWRMLTTVKSRVQRGIDAGLHETNNTVAAAATYAKEYIAKWKLQNPNKDFPSSAIICGWDKKKPKVYDTDIECNGNLAVSEAQGTGFVHGSGERYVRLYYNMDPPLPSREGQPLRSNEELRQIAKRAVVFAALHDSHTGGGVRVDEVRQDGHTESDAEEILKVLSDDYDKLKTHLSRFIFCLYPKSEIEYASDCERLIVNAFRSRFALRIKEIGHVMGIKGKYVIRILGFVDDSAAKEEFEALRSDWKILGYGHTEDVTVHPTIRALPWVQFHNLNGVPFAFAKPTRDMLELFLDL